MQSIEETETFYRSLEPSILAHTKELDKRILATNEKLEGNCFYLHNSFIPPWFLIYKRMNFVMAMKTYAIKKMVEIGFNGGHSAALFLSMLPQDGSILFFDLNDHTYTRSCFEYLRAAYPQVRDLIAGDSMKTLPTWMQAHMEEVGTFDLVHVDGGHSPEVSHSDMMLAHFLLKPGGIMILDDTQIEYITEYIPFLIGKGYKFLYQIPTYHYAHVLLQKPTAA